MLRSYARLICFTFGLLWGVQAPSFTDQYVKRVDAHRAEARRGFAGFQLIADQMFHGNVEALIAHHRGSSDPVFVREAHSIEALYERVQMLEAEWNALQGPLWRRMLHVAFRSDHELFRETVEAYSYTVPLTAAAIACGLIAGVLVSFLVELCLLGVARALQARPRPAQRRRAAP